MEEKQEADGCGRQGLRAVKELAESLPNMHTELCAAPYKPRGEGRRIICRSSHPQVIVSGTGLGQEGPKKAMEQSQLQGQDRWTNIGAKALG